MQFFNVYMVGGRVVRTWAFCIAQAGTELMILLPSHWWEYRFVLPHLPQKYVRLLAEKKTQQAAAAFAEDLGLVATMASDLLGYQACMWCTYVNAGKNTHKIYLIKLYKRFWPSQTLARVEWMMWVCVVSCGNGHRGRDVFVPLPLSS